MNNEYYYTTKIDWTDGRKGDLSVDGFPVVEVATPPEFAKGVPNTWSPEHLFVASANVCLMTTFLAIAENSKLEFESFSCEGKGKMERVEKRFMFTEIELTPTIVVTQEKDIERAERIVQKAEEHCLISNSMKTKIILKPKIELKN